MAEVNNNLLFELGTEELPPKSLLKLSHALLENIKKGLDQADLNYEDTSVYATPRRLAVAVYNLSGAQPDKIIEKRGPALQAAFNDDGSPSKAAEGFAKSCQTTVRQLDRLKTDKGEWLAYKQQIKGKLTESLLPEIITKSIHALPIAKRMRWGDSVSEFARPVHWVVLLYANKIIETRILGIDTSNQTQGHRFHAPGMMTVASAEEYADKLNDQGMVIADFEKRKEIIRGLAKHAAHEVNGKVIINEDLLEEITALNEWPVAITGNYDSRYLNLPAEVLMTTMQVNQKYFPVVDVNNDLLPYFITISNIDSSNPETIKRGNERVIKPRLADAEFFWNQDRKRSLRERAPDLAGIVFQNKLGSLADKTNRVEQLVDNIAESLGISSEMPRQAAMLAKTDLLTDMVGEFPGLQGIMGRYYAEADGEPPELALALEEQYYPKQSGSPTPGSICGQILAIAEKIDTLGGIFSAGLIPTGDKDPYALRRAALGVLRIIIENKLDLDLSELITNALQLYKHDFEFAKTYNQVIDFIFERLKGYCLDRGYCSDEFDAVYSLHPSKPLDFEERLHAVKMFRQLPEAKSLAAANKRIRNIIRKTETLPHGNFSLLTAPEELKLLQTAKKTAQEIQPLLHSRDYQSALNHLAQLRNDVDSFFDNVMVMTDDLPLRASRLGLLSMLSDQFMEIADISKLQS